ncbi:T9SS type A sorting domain-containing protein [Hymenobacter humi]|uniref:T9SS type A sorting domain-containing protein n=1 Tax=Hymenobacter humi TaxID=1411620 RepID=A0ABW2UAL0_9BACT
MSSIEFVSGSVFTGGQNFAGTAFGSVTALQNSVVFRNGARYEQYAGSAPFALNQPNSITVFEPASHYLFAPTGYIQVPFSGRTYGTFEYSITFTNTGTATYPVTFGGDLIITKGTIAINAIGGVNIKGNLLVNSGSTLAFNPASATTLQFNGSAPQVIGGTAGAGALTFGDNVKVTVANPMGVSLRRPITLNNALTLSSGKVTTTATNLLTLGAAATISTANENTFIDGPLARVTGPGASSVTFPVGKGAGRRSLTLDISSQTAASTYTAELLEGNPGQNLAPTNLLGGVPLKRVSHIRSYSLSSSNATPGNASGTVTLSFGTDDGVNDPTDAGLVIAAKTPGLDWQSFGRSGSTGAGSGAGAAWVPGTLTSAPIGSLANAATFALGATNENTTFGAALNPLPVVLSRFTAQRQPNQAVTIKWATASEKNSAFFEVQRSLDGRDFATVAKQAAQGNSTQATAYTALDQSAPAGTLYYRLRQMDADGKISYSAVATVARVGAAAKVLLYPNPANSAISLITDAATPYRVVNQLGRTLLRGTTEAGISQLAIGSLAPGVYLLELQTSTGRVIAKFEKE